MENLIVRTKSLRVMHFLFDGYYKWANASDSLMNFCCLVGEGKDLRTITFGFLPHTKQVNIYNKCLVHMLFLTSRTVICQFSMILSWKLY